MKQLTIRGFDEELEERLERLARERGISLNKAALLLMRRGAGVGGEVAPERVVGDALDEFIGQWTEEEERRFLESIDVLEQVDESLWR
jgi:hypothetical protein